MNELIATSLEAVALLIVFLIVFGTIVYYFCGVRAEFGGVREKKQKRREQRYVALKKARHKARAHQAHHSEQGASLKALFFLSLQLVLVPLLAVFASLGANESLYKDYGLPEPTSTAMPMDAPRKVLSAGNDAADGVKTALERRQEDRAALREAIRRNNRAEYGFSPPNPPDDLRDLRDAPAKRGFLETCSQNRLAPRALTMAVSSGYGFT